MTEYRPIPLNEEEDEDFQCMLCSEIAYKPTLCPKCQNNVYCDNCIKTWLVKNPTCPACKFKWLAEDVVTNRFVQKKIEKLDARCYFDDCSYKASYTEVMEHIPNCPFNYVECPYANNGCTKKVTKNELDKHVKKCGYKEIRCRKCKEIVFKKDITVYHFWTVYLPYRLISKKCV